MTGNRALLLLLLLAVAGAWACWLEFAREDALRQSASLPSRVVPLLEPRLGEVARVRVRRGTGELEILREGDRWVLPALDGYPARDDAVRRLLASVSLLRPIEPRTAVPQRFPQLGVQDPGQAGPAETTWIEILDGADRRIAGLVVGLSNPTLAAHGRYVRQAGGERAWLVDADLDFSLDPLDWADGMIWNLDRSRLARLEIRHADGPAVVAERVEEGRPPFRLLDLPPGWKPLAPDVANYLGAALSELTIRGVARATESSPPAGASHAIYRTYDGLELEAWVWKEDDAWFGRFTAGALAGAGPGVRAEAAAFQERLADWIFRLPPHKADVLARRLEDIAGPDPELQVGPPAPGQDSGKGGGGEQDGGR